ncbi:MAG: YceI family protein [Bradymonadales bacterium]|nr:YceI family protein [Bradymonadales bacterium]
MNYLRHTMTALAAAFVLTIAGGASATQFAFSPGGLSQLVFVSDAPLETITGTSNVITGEVNVDLQNPGAATGWVSADATSFRTGIDLRDEHLRGEMWIDAAQYPELRFELVSVNLAEGAVLNPAEPLEGEVIGNLTFHGVTREITAPARLTYYELDEETRQSGAMTGLVNNVLRVEVQFTFLLSDYGVSIPSVLQTKVADLITVTLRLTGIQQ